MKEKKIIKTLHKSKHEPKPHTEPTVPYKRRRVVVRSNWFWHLLETGNYHVAFQYILIWLSIFLIIIFFILLIAQFFGGSIVDMLLKLIGG